MLLLKTNAKSQHLQRNKSVLGGKGSDAHQPSLLKKRPEEELLMLTDDVRTKIMGLISHEYIHAGEELWSPEHRGSEMKTGDKNLGNLEMEPYQLESTMKSNNWWGSQGNKKEASLPFGVCCYYWCRVSELFDYCSNGKVKGLLAN